MPYPDEEDTEPLCGPKPTKALITPPDETEPLRVSAPFGTVCKHGEIDMGALTDRNRR